MASSRDIKRKIRSVSATRRIVRAMEAVAAAKLRKARPALLRSRPYSEKLKEAVFSIAAHTGGGSVFFTARAPERPLVIAIASDKGLCGDFNANVLNALRKFAEEHPNASFITVGVKIHGGVAKGASAGVLAAFHAARADYTLAAKIGRKAAELYLKGDFTEVYLIYTAFKSAIWLKPETIKVLPVERQPAADSGRPMAQMLFEPSAAEVLDAVIPKYMNAVIYGALSESQACFYAAQSAAMRKAGENADEMLETLIRRYNRARQEAITAEITEIVR